MPAEDTQALNDLLALRELVGKIGIEMPPAPPSALVDLPSYVHHIIQWLANDPRISPEMLRTAVALALGEASAGNN